MGKVLAKQSKRAWVDPPNMYLKTLRKLGRLVCPFPLSTKEGETRESLEPISQPALPNWKVPDLVRETVTKKSRYP